VGLDVFEKSFDPPLPEHSERGEGKGERKEERLIDQQQRGGEEEL